MIENAENRVSYKGDGKATEFAIPFSFIDKEDVVVVIVDPEYRETTLEKDYFVDMEKKTVLYPGYPPGEEPPESEKPQVLPAGWKIVIYRDIDVTQEESLGDLWPFNLIEKGLDKLTMICQDLFYSTKRMLRLPAGAEDDVDTTLPAPTPNASIYWDDTGKKLVTGGNPNLAAGDAAASAQAAAKSQELALGSANAAALSEQHAATSEENAANSEAAAAESAARAEQAAGGVGDPVISVEENNGKVTVETANGNKNEFWTGLNTLQRNKEYAVGDIAYSPNLKSYQYLECITAGTTGDTEPDFSTVTTGG